MHKLVLFDGVFQLRQVSEPPTVDAILHTYNSFCASTSIDKKNSSLEKKELV